MFFIVRKKLLQESMKNYNFLNEFNNSFRHIGRKHKTLDDDFQKFKKIIENFPEGIGKNFTTIYSEQTVKVIKARMACRALRKRSLRVIYGFCENEKIFYFIEIYYRGDQANESKPLINSFLKRFK